MNGTRLQETELKDTRQMCEHTGKRKREVERIVSESGRRGIKKKKKLSDVGSEALWEQKR